MVERKRERERERESRRSVLLARLDDDDDDDDDSIKDDTLGGSNTWFWDEFDTVKPRVCEICESDGLINPNSSQV